MSYLILALVVLALIFAPYFLSRMGSGWPWWSPVIACFVVGFAAGNSSAWWTNSAVLQSQCKNLVEITLTGSVLLAIPLLLMTSDLRNFRRQIGPFFVSFLLCIVAVLLATVAAVSLFSDLEHLPIVAGSMTAVYVGGTPNMVSVLYALQAPATLSGILIATDSLCSGIYFLFLVSSAKAFYNLFLKPPSLEQEQEPLLSTVEETTASSIPWWRWQRVQPILQAVLAAVLCIAFSVGVATLFPNASGGLNELVVLLVLTTSSLLLSFWPRVRNLIGVYDFGQYLMLIFALAIGYLVDFSSLIEKGGYYLSFNVAFLALLLLIHLLIARLFRIDTHTFIMTATACIMGPPFVGAVCEAIHRRDLLAPSMTLAIVGLITGTYLGVAVALALNFFY